MYEADAEGGIWRDGNRRRTTIGKTGYERVQLSVNGRTSCQNVHRLVAEAFYGELPVGCHVNHLNGVKHDNRVSNLAVVDPKENYDHARRTLARRGTAANTAKLTDADVMEIRRRGATGAYSADLAAEYGVLPGTISRIRSGRSWSHLPILPQVHPPERHPRRVLRSDAEIGEVLRRHDDGERMLGISTTLGVSIGSVRRVLVENGRTPRGSGNPNIAEMNRQRASAPSGQPAPP